MSQLWSSDGGDGSETETASRPSRVKDSVHRAQALARHVKAALLHLRQPEDIADLAGIDPCASEHDVPAVAIFRAAGDAVQDLDARAQGAAPTDTYQHTERWCHAPGGALPDTSRPRGPHADREDWQ